MLLTKYCGALLVIILMSCGHGTFKDCKRYHTGSFYFTPHLSHKKIFLMRGTVFQSEIDSVNKKRIEKEITWKDDCHFELSFRRVVSEERTSDGTVMQTVENDPNPTIVTILGGNDSYYISRTTDKVRRPSIDTVWIIK